MVSPISSSFQYAGYDARIIQDARDAIERSRELLERTKLLVPPPSLGDLLADANQLVTETEQRRDRQIRLVAKLAKDVEARPYDEQILHEITRTLAIARTHRSTMRSLAKDERPYMRSVP
ncbi:hypothetical protein [Methylobacterium nigriterrae]|uniref:hypothetical protein n=1 Tax=Methylobacterium nigriterrae TaxID=3127512 RepID=UPI00301416AD